MKLSLVFHCVVMMFIMMPTAAMDKPAQQQRAMIHFHWKDGTNVAIKKSHVPLIKTLENLYKSSQKNRSVELFSYVRQHHYADSLSVVEDALDVLEKAGIDFEENKQSYMSGSLETEFKFDYISEQFKKYYRGLSLERQNILIKLSGQYSGQTAQMGNNVVSIPMLNIPELAKHLIEVCVQAHDVRDLLKSYFNNNKVVIGNYFKERLICAKRPFLPLKEHVGGPHNYFIAKLIHPGALFINGYRTDHGTQFPISLFTNDKLYETYGYSFFTDEYECRVTQSVEDQPSDQSKKEYCLWGINHKNGSSELLAFIEHTHPIKGVRFSKTKKNVEYVVTYSDHDMVFSHIAVDPEGISFIESVCVVSPHAGTIVGMCFNYDYQDNNPLVRVGTHEEVNSVSRYWNMHGVSGVEIIFPFQKFGVLDQIFESRTFDRNNHELIFSFGEEYDIYTFKDLHNQQGGCMSSSRSGLWSAHDLCSAHRTVARLNGSCFVSETSHSPFAFMVNADQRQAKNNFFAQIVDDFSSYGNPDSESFKVYSPDGSMLLVNMLKKKLGLLYVETTVKDASAHIPIISIDTLYSDFVGVGFSIHSSYLVFLNFNPILLCNNRVALLDDTDKAMLKKAEGLMLGNVFTAAWLKQLCMECKKNGIVKVVEGGNNHKVLMAWAKSSKLMLNFLQKCLPIEVIKSL